MAESADPADPRAVAWRLLLQTHRTLVPILADELDEAVALPLGAYDVLLHLSEAPRRRLRLSALAERVLLSASGLSRVVDRLEAVSLVSRQPDPSDRRALFAVLTDRGRDVLRCAAPVHLEGVARHFTDHLTTDEAEVVAGALRRVLAAQGVELDGKGRRVCG